VAVLYDSWTSTAAGSPTGDILRRFWVPVAPVTYLDDDPIRRICVLSEWLVLFRSHDGLVGLLQQRCPHNFVMLDEGSLDNDGIICYEHGWHFSITGDACLKLPSGPFPMRRFQATAYPVREYGDLYWAYFGPEPAPELPADEILNRTDGHRVITVAPLDRNWLADEWADSGQWRRQFGLAPVASDDDSVLVLRLPIDDKSAHQISVKFVPGAAGDAEVIYLDEEDSSQTASGSAAVDRGALFEELGALRP
jgi:nitrite reductase/ring-hydroxylating ferredoxin subunit